MNRHCSLFENKIEALLLFLKTVNKNLWLFFFIFVLSLQLTDDKKCSWLDMNPRISVIGSNCSTYQLCQNTLLRVFLNRPLQAPFIYFRLFNTADSKQMYYIKVPPMTGFEPLTSGIRSDHSTNWATTTIFVFSKQLIVIKCTILKFRRWLDLNRWPLASEATTLPTEPQPLPTFYLVSFC